MKLACVRPVDVDECDTAGEGRVKTCFRTGGLVALLDSVWSSITASPASSTQRGEITCSDRVQCLIAGGEL